VLQRVLRSQFLKAFKNRLDYKVSGRFKVELVLQCDMKVDYMSF